MTVFILLSGETIDAEKLMEVIGVPSEEGWPSTTSADAGVVCFADSKVSQQYQNKTYTTRPPTTSLLDENRRRLEENERLLEENERLLEENERMKTRLQCKICLSADVEILFLPCRHLACCEKCTDDFRDCPVCRREIMAVVKTYL